MEAHRHERWVLWCSYFKPHGPYTPPREDWDRYAGRPLPVPVVDDGAAGRSFLPTLRPRASEPATTNWARMACDVRSSATTAT